MKFALLAFALFATATSAPASILYVGPSHTFKQIQPAINAAQPGDTIIVSPGGYGAFVLNKGVDILGPGSNLASVSVSTPDKTPVVIQNIAFGEHAVVSGFKVHSANTGCQVYPFGGSSTACVPTIKIYNCQGRIGLSDVRAGKAGSSWGGGWDVLNISLASQVLLIDCAFIGESWSESVWSFSGPALRVEHSSVYIAFSTLIGGSGESVSSGTLSGLGPVGQAAIISTSSTLEVVHSDMRGGDGGKVSSPFLPDLYFSGQPAIQAVSTDMYISGGAGTSDEIKAGKSIGLNCQDGEASVEMAANSIGYFYDGHNIVGGDPPFPASFCPGALPGPIHIPVSGPNVFDLPDHAPTLRSDPLITSLGAQVTLKGTGEANAAMGVFWSPALTMPYSTQGIGGIGQLDMSSMHVLLSMQLDAAGVGQVALTVPLSTAFIGETIYLQALQLGQYAGLSNPWFATIRF